MPESELPLYCSSSHLPGSHTSLVLLGHGYSVVIIDNLENSKYEAFRRLKELAGEHKDRLTFVKVEFEIV